MKISSKNILVAYFSRKGKNIVSGRIVNLTVGNTEVAAEMIKELTKSNMFRIEALHTYPEDYTETTEVAQQELRADARPQLTGHVERMDSYELVFLGYPIWWATMPMPVCTFLEEYDFSGKTIAPFCTHEGSGLGRSEKDIAKLCTHSTIMDGLAVRGGDVKNARNEVSGWLRKLRIIA
jgi:flavodoxin